MRDLEKLAELLGLTEEEIEQLKGGSIELTFKPNGDLKSYWLQG